MKLPVCVLPPKQPEVKQCFRIKTESGYYQHTFLGTEENPVSVPVYTADKNLAAIFSSRQQAEKCMEREIIVGEVELI